MYATLKLPRYYLMCLHVISWERVNQYFNVFLSIGWQRLRKPSIWWSRHRKGTVELVINKYQVRKPISMTWQLQSDECICGMDVCISAMLCVVHGIHDVSCIWLYPHVSCPGIHYCGLWSNYNVRVTFAGWLKYLAL